MSADNFLAVHHIGDRWYVYDGCASVPDEDHKPDKDCKSFSTREEALTYAVDEMDDDYYEYGIRIIKDSDEITLLKDIGTQIAQKEVVLCPDCRDIEKLEQPLCSVGDHENELFCPHCNLHITLKLSYRHDQNS